MLEWQYDTDEIGIYDDKYGCELALVRGEDGGIFFRQGEDVFEIKEEDIKYVAFEEPKFLKKGTIAFFDEDEEILAYVCDGRVIKCIIDVTKKQKNEFYAIFDVLNNNGIETLAL